MVDALFQRDGEYFLPTEASGSPWGEQHTGGGPVAGLLARAIETDLDDPERHIGRLSFDLMRPVPKAPLAVTTRTVRAGNRLRILEAVLSSDGVEMARCTAHAIRRTETDDKPCDGVPFAGPEQFPSQGLLPEGMYTLFGVHDLIDVRWVQDRTTSPSRTWMRLPVPLLCDEPMTPLVHTAVLADCVNAMSPIVGIAGPSINTDIALYLHRELSGDWLGFEAERHTQPTGVGVANATLYDRQGPIGVATEMLLSNRLG